MSQKVNSIIKTKNGVYSATETLEQIQQLSQNSKLVLVHLEQNDTKGFLPFLLNVDQVEMVLDYNADYVDVEKPHDDEDNDNSADTEAAKALLKALFEAIAED